MSSISDPISDYLTRIRNACHGRKEEVSIPASNLKRRLTEILKEEGFIEDFSFVKDRQQGVIVIQLRYDDEGQSSIRGIQRKSKPSRRIYATKTELPRVNRGLGTAILSTSRGIMTDKAARREGVGGEYLISIW